MNKIFVPDEQSEGVYPSQKEMDYMKKNMDKEVSYPHLVRDSGDIVEFSIMKTVELMKEELVETKYGKGKFKTEGS